MFSVRDRRLAPLVHLCARRVHCASGEGLGASGEGPDGAHVAPKKGPPRRRGGPGSSMAFTRPLSQARNPLSISCAGFCSGRHRAGDFRLTRSRNRSASSGSRATPRRESAPRRIFQHPFLILLSCRAGAPARIDALASWLTRPPKLRRRPRRQLKPFREHFSLFVYRIMSFKLQIAVFLLTRLRLSSP